MKKLYIFIFIVFGWLTVFSQAPLITLSPNYLDSFYTVLTAPSAPKSYTVQGTNLTSGIYITHPAWPYANFEVSLTENPFVVGTIYLAPVAGTVPPTTIYMRMHSVYVGNVFDAISHNSTGATEKYLSGIGNVLAPEPTVQSSISFGARTNNSIVVNLNGGNGQQRILYVKESSPVDATPFDGHFYNSSGGVFGVANTNVGNGNYAVYKGAGQVVTVTGLTAGKIYYFAVHEFDKIYGQMYPPGPTNYGDDGTENFLLPGTTGNETTTYAPVTYDWIGGSGSWATAANWSPLRTSAATNDILRFSNGNTITVTNVPHQSIGQLHINSGSQVTLQAAMASTVFAINGSIAGDDLVVDAGSSLNITGANAYGIKLETGNTGAIHGNMTFTGGAHKLTSIDANGITFHNGSSFTAGTGFSGNAFGNGTANSIVFTGGSLYQQLAGSDPFALTEPAAVAVFNQGSLFKLRGNITPSVSGRTYSNFELDAPVANINASGISLLSIDNLTVTNGSLTFGMTSSGMNVRKNIFVAPGASLHFAPASPGTLHLNGTVAQSIANAGTLVFSADQIVNINNAAGITLHSPVAISGTVNFTSGILTTTATSPLILSAGSSATNASNASFVYGPVKKVGNSDFTFPVGKGNGLVPLRISNFTGGTATDEFTTEYIRTNASLLGPVTDPLIHHVSRCEYWTLGLNNGSPTVDITLYWNANNPCGGTYINDLAQLQIAHFNNISWNTNSIGSRAVNGNTAAGDITWFGVSNFSPFTLASTSAANPLPIVINYFKGTKQGNHHLLNWKVTCISTPSVTMELQRSGDSRNFNSINSITADAARCNQPFNYTDTDPLKGINYYRLKMTDADGKISYSSIVSLLNASKGFEIISIAPNPVTNGNFKLNIASAKSSNMELVVVDMQGRMVNRQALAVSGGFNNVPVNVSGLSAGTYLLYGMIDGERSKAMRFVIQ